MSWLTRLLRLWRIEERTELDCEYSYAEGMRE